MEYNQRNRRPADVHAYSGPLNRRSTRDTSHFCFWYGCTRKTLTETKRTQEVGWGWVEGGYHLFHPSLACTNQFNFVSSAESIEHWTLD